MSESAVQAYRDHFEREAASLPGAEHAWLQQRRREAMQSFVERGFPTRRVEDWRQTPIESVTGQARATAVPIEGFDSPARTLSLAGDAVRLTFVDGHFAPGLSILPELGDGVHVAPLASELAGTSPGLEGGLGALADPKTCAFRALNTALFADGAHLTLDAGTRLTRTVHLLFLASGSDVLISPRVLIELGPESSATVVEQYAAAGDGTSFTNTVTEIALGAGSRLAHVKLQAESPQAVHVASIGVRQEAGSQLRSWSIAAGGRLARTEIHTALADLGAHCDLYGLYLARDRQLVDHHTWVDHASPETTSNELYKGILDDRARGVFRGRVHVRPDAQKIDAAQSHRSLMLSEGASVHAQPQLEIYADDVKCSHGNAIGQLDPDALFYLRSRGIPEAQARSTLTAAFAREVTQELPPGPLRDDLDGLLQEWLT